MNDKALRGAFLQCVRAGGVAWSVEELAKYCRNMAQRIRAGKLPIAQNLGPVQRQRQLNAIGRMYDRTAKTLENVHDTLEVQ